MLDNRIVVPTHSRKKVWIDLDNSPHVPFFKPIIAELTKSGYEVSVTTRNCFQVFDLANLMQLRHTPIGRHYGKNKVIKVAGALLRSMQLLPFAFKLNPSLALSHGSRSQLLVANALRIPSIEISDYEYATGIVFFEPTIAMMPDVIPDSSIHSHRERVRKYPGIKEDVYVPHFKPERGILEQLGLEEQDLVVVVRPPANEAHYHSHETQVLFETVVEFLGNAPPTRMVMLPRNKAQEAVIEKTWREWCRNGKIVIPRKVVDGLNLIWHSDLVISGGGTMNREAAALGVPVYSIFRSEIGAVDRYLSASGRLILIQDVVDIASKIALKRRAKPLEPHAASCETLGFILKEIARFLEEPIAPYQNGVFHVDQ